MICSFSDPTLLKKILGALSKDMGAMNLNFDENGMSIQAVNASNTNMRDFILHKSFFMSYECPVAKTIGVHIGVLNTFVKTAGSKDSISWKINDNCTMDVIIQDASENNTCTTFTLKLLDITVDQLAMPQQINWTCHCQIGSDLLKQWISKSKLLDGNVTIQVVRGKCINVKVLSDSGDVKITQPIPSFKANIIEMSQDVEKIDKTISYREVECIDQLLQCAPNIDIQYHNDYPMCCTTYLDPEMKSYARMWIAPMMDDEDMNN